MKKTLTVALFALIASAAFTTAVNAELPELEKEMTASNDKFASLDVDSDGLISLEEASADPMISAAFSQLDADSDGFLTPSELGEY